MLTLWLNAIVMQSLVRLKSTYIADIILGLLMEYLLLFAWLLFDLEIAMTSA